MICSTCKTEEAGDNRRCKACNAQYMKDYRANKVKADPMPKESMEVEHVEPQAKYVHKDPVKVHPIFNSTIYMSYYVTPGTAIHKKMLEAEKLMQAAA